MPPPVFVASVATALPKPRCCAGAHAARSRRLSASLSALLRRLNKAGEPSVLDHVTAPTQEHDVVAVVVAGVPVYMVSVCGFFDAAPFAVSAERKRLLRPLSLRGRPRVIAFPKMMPRAGRARFAPCCPAAPKLTQRDRLFRSARAPAQHHTHRELAGGSARGLGKHLPLSERLPDRGWRWLRPHGTPIQPTKAAATRPGSLRFALSFSR